MSTHYEQLTVEECAAMMIMANNCSARQIELSLSRTTSTITRELARFYVWPDRSASQANPPADLDARASGLRAWRARFKCRKRAKLVTDNVLFVVFQHSLALDWSHSRIVGTLMLMWPEEPQHNVCHDSIFTCISATPQRVAQGPHCYLCRAKTKRTPRRQGEDCRGQMPVWLSIHVRAPEASDWQYPEH
jgi:IS30 family transposase